jgi:type VI protein secretion system component Hcp
MLYIPTVEPADVLPAGDGLAAASGVTHSDITITKWLDKASPILPTG